MLGSRGGGDESQVTCIACGETVARTAAREYDKHGDRWDRGDKEFEYLCKTCHRSLCHQPREGLETLLVESSAGDLTREEFLDQFMRLAEERPDPERRER